MDFVDSGNKNNCYLSTDDTVRVVIWPKEESDAIFGEDMVRDFGSYLPPDLIARYERVRNEWWEVQQELKEIMLADRRRY